MRNYKPSSMAEAEMRFAVFLTLFVAGVCSIPEQGKWQFNYNNKPDGKIFGVYKSMYKGSKVAVTVKCESSEEVELSFRWVLRYSPCSEEYIGIDTKKESLQAYLSEPGKQWIKEFKYREFEFIRNSSLGVKCSDAILLPDFTKQKPEIVKDKTNETSTNQANKKGQDATKSTKMTTGTSTVKPTTTPKPTPAKPANEPPPPKPANGKRDTRAAVTDAKKAKALTNETKPTMKAGEHSDKQYLLQTWKDGFFVFILEVGGAPENREFSAEVIVEMVGDHGYISASDWPLLIFYGVMGIVYILYGVAWLVMLACSWRDLLRVQFWIGGVIALGMLEKAVFYTEFQTIANTGRSVRGAVIFAELVSCLKRTIARILVIIVSLGFGIVKPRLGPTFRKVIGVGALYFLVGSLEGCMRQLQSKGDNSKDILAAQVPLAVIDASICWWIFSSLLQTTRTLRLRRNIVKLSLYRHFTNTLIFAVLASIVYMIWSISQHKLKVCITDWRELWVDDAFWHLLFSVILLVIMILWRPSANNQRYAFSPLLDAADDEVEEEEPMMNDAFDGMKMRGMKGTPNGSPKQRDGRSSIEDDLKWVEENIPTSITDKALPSLLDSDEEMMTSKYEVNKMQ